MATTAEGVETILEMDLVREAGVTAIQGYLLSKPVPFNEIEELVRLINHSDECLTNRGF